MRNLLFSSPTGYLMLGNIFRNNITPGRIRQCSRQYMRNSNAVKSSQLLGNCTSRISKKAVSDFTNKKVITYFSKRLCSNFQRQTRLMDFGVVINPTIFYFLKVTVLRLVISKSIDEEFSMPEFVKNSKLAMEVVTGLLSELKFQELEGLLTNECREEVQKNVRALEPAKRYKLAVKNAEILFSFPYNLEIIKGGNDSEKTFVQITMVYHIHTDSDKLKSQNTLSKEEFARFAVYNCRFIKEFTEGVYDQWTINAINVCFLSELIQTD